MSAPALIFCIGAAKSGTSWLHDYLRGHEEVRLRRLKELHYFDTLHSGSDWHLRHMAGKLEEYRERLARKGPLGSNAFLPEVIEDLQEWLALFDGSRAIDRQYMDYLRGGQSGGGELRAIGDFTPAYALLPGKVFARMAGLAEKVRFIFLMRDPLARLWSNVRMNVGKRGPGAAKREVDSFLAGKNRNLAERSDYRATLDNLLGAVPREMVHLEFYERLFTPEAIERLCRFLGLTPAPAEFGRVVHRGGQQALDMPRQGELLDALRPQYDYVENLLGALPGAWTDRMVRI